MTVEKVRALPYAQRFFTLSIDSFSGHILAGRIYHDTIKEGIAFDSISGMMLMLEEMFDQLQYPMRSVEYRKFDKKFSRISPKESVVKNVSEDKIPGRLADFRLHVQHRFYGTWQGDITNLQDGNTFSFLSFMELMEYLDRILGEAGEESKNGLGKKMCEVALQSCDRLGVRGDVSHPSVEQRHTFSNEFELLSGIKHIVNPLLEEQREGNVIIPRSMTVSNLSSAGSTFVVRVLFRRNATWQGTICWKEKKRQVNFRSFMELLLLMHEAVADSGAWGNERAACRKTV